jgi:hypothetical protein
MVQLTTVVPFLVEDELLRLGAIYEKTAHWLPFSTDGRLLTGQNPAPSTSAAQALLKLVGQQAIAAAPSIESVSQNPRVASNAGHPLQHLQERKR